MNIPGGDVSEAGLDGILQTVLCREYIGWNYDKKPFSQKFIIYISDSPFHIAMDVSNRYKPTTGDTW